jgi:hypothetical protein
MGSCGAHRPPGLVELNLGVWPTCSVCYVVATLLLALL